MLPGQHSSQASRTGNAFALVAPGTGSMAFALAVAFAVPIRAPFGAALAPDNRNFHQLLILNHQLLIINQPIANRQIRNRKSTLEVT